MPGQETAVPVLRVCGSLARTGSRLWAGAWAREPERPERLLGIVFMKQSLGWSRRKKQASEL